MFPLQLLGFDVDAVWLSRALCGMCKFWRVMRVLMAAYFHLAIVHGAIIFSENAAQPCASLRCQARNQGLLMPLHAPWYKSQLA